MSASYQSRVSRRTTLKWIGAFAASVTLPRGLAAAQGVFAYIPTANGYGTDPNLIEPVVPWQRMMTGRQLLLAAVFSDLMLPATATAPAPSAVGVPDFIDEWVSAPYPDQQADRAIVLDGLAWLDAEAERRWRHGFAEATDAERLQILDDIAGGGAAATDRPGEFLARLRLLVVGAYYTTQAGFDDIGYVGNTALDHYPAPSEDEIAVLEEELQKLGL